MKHTEQYTIQNNRQEHSRQNNTHTKKTTTGWKRKPHPSQEQQRPGDNYLTQKLKLLKCTHWINTKLLHTGDK